MAIKSISIDDSNMTRNSFEIHIFGLQQSEFGLDPGSCIVSASSNIQADSFIVVSCGGGVNSEEDYSPFICLRTVVSDVIGNDDVLCNSWVLDTLGCCHGNTISALTFTPTMIDISIVSEVSLTFQHYKSHHNIMSTSSSFFPPNCWIHEWPSGVSLNTLNKLLHIFLHDKILVNSSLIVIDVFDVSLVSHLK